MCYAENILCLSSSGDGRWAIFSFRESARMCFSSSFCWACRAGAAVELGRMFSGVSLSAKDSVGQERIEEVVLGEGGVTLSQLVGRGPVGEMLLERVLPLRIGSAGRDGRLVDGGLVLGGHCLEQ